MQTSAALAATVAALTLIKSNQLAPAFRVGGLDMLFVDGGLIVDFGDVHADFADGTPVTMPAHLAPGLDYEIVLTDPATLEVHAYGVAAEGGHPVVGGFHYAPGGNAMARAGGDRIPAINPFSIYDLDFRPACADPRGMTLVDGKFWADIYLLGTNHAADATSECGATIATGRSLPKLDYATAVSILAGHGKQVMSFAEYADAAYGVVEKSAREEKPERTGLADDGAEKFTSKWGLFNATGHVWVWGHDGDPDEPRASIFGGSWINGSLAGSRFATLDCWAGSSSGDIGARGRSDHLTHA